MSASELSELFFGSICRGGGLPCGKNTCTIAGDMNLLRRAASREAIERHGGSAGKGRRRRV